MPDEADQHHFFAVDRLPDNTVPEHVERIRDALNGAAHPIFRRKTALSTQTVIGKS